MSHQGAMEHGDLSNVQSEWMEIVSVWPRFDPKGCLCKAIICQGHPEIDFSILSRSEAKVWRMSLNHIQSSRLYVGYCHSKLETRTLRMSKDS